MYSVSVIIATYNSDLKKIKTTLKSVINQKKIKLQIIVCDDGSEDNHFTEIEAYFKKNNFNNYELVANKENRGTVINVLSGCERAEGDYIKSLAPGDGLIHSCVLYEWISNMENENKKWSFSDVMYYNIDNNIINILKMNSYPQDVIPYIKHNDLKARWNYVVLKDIAVGVAMIAKTEVYINYLNKIVGKVVYAEDNVWRLMSFDGVVASYFSKPAVFYEYGFGVSTSGDSEWGRRLTKDWLVANHEMIKYSGNDLLKNRMIKALKLEENDHYRFYSQFFKGKVRLSLKRKLCPRKTYVPIGQELEHVIRLLTI